MGIPEKYNLPEAELYRERLRAKVEGRPLPTDLPKRERPQANATGAAGGAAGDVDTIQRLPNETDEQYVARQRRLREAASARMREKFGGGRMTGIGSSAGYNPATGSYGGGGGGGGGGPDFSEQLNVVGEGIGKTWQLLSENATALAGQTAHTLEEAKIGETLSSGWKNLSDALGDDEQRTELLNNVSENVKTGWSTLAAGATSLWSQALAAVDPEQEEEEGQTGTEAGAAQSFGLGPSGMPEESKPFSDAAPPADPVPGARPPMQPAQPVQPVNLATRSEVASPAPAAGTGEEDPWAQVVKTSPARSVSKDKPAAAPAKAPPTGEDFFSSFGV